MTGTIYPVDIADLHDVTGFCTRANIPRIRPSDFGREATVSVTFHNSALFLRQKVRRKSVGVGVRCTLRNDVTLPFHTLHLYKGFGTEQRL
jgi:hypothetical protein